MDIENATHNDTQQAGAAQKHVHKHKITIFIMLCVLNVALLVLLWSQLLTPAQQPGRSGTNTSNTSSLGDISSPLLGKPAPDFTLPVLKEGPGPSQIHLADLKGKPVVLNFWASWCAPCNDEAPLVQKSWLKLKSRGIVFIGIDGPEKPDAALTFMHKYRISYPIVQDAVNSTTAIDYGVTGLPETIFIDRNGKVAAKWASPLNEQGLELETAKLTR